MNLSRLRTRFAAGSLSRSLLTIALLAAVIVVTIALVNRHYFFQDQAFETGDEAANSLDVLRCEKFDDILGAYSRWGFHHPGPFLFYWLAAGETLFWRLIPLTRTPINAQVLSVLCLSAGFFAAGVAIAARWVRSPFFAPLILLFAALHYTSASLTSCMLDTWPPYVSTLPYFCLLVAAASVAAGQGEDLPWLALAGCVLIHIHVANPLYVLPLFILSYAGLLQSRLGKGRARPEKSPPGAAWPWERFPRAHILAAILCSLFLLPILLDLSRGAQSNFALILNHLRVHRGEHHRYLDAIYYVLCFGVYRPSHPPNVQVFDGVTAHAIFRFFGTHLTMLLIWTGALLSPAAALALRVGVKPPAGTSTAQSARGLNRDRWTFLGWLLACLALCLGLAIYWAHIQDGEMFFYNARYLYSLYGVLLLAAAVALSDLLELIAELIRLRSLVTATAAISCSVAALALIIRPHPPGSNVALLGDLPDTVAQARTVMAALAASPGAPRTKLLVLPDEPALASAPGIAILLKREGYDFRVVPIGKNMFGPRYTLPDSWMESGSISAGPVPMDLWWMVRRSPATAVSDRPLVDNLILKTGESEINPATEPVISFAGPNHNSRFYAMCGFEQAPDDGLWAWTLGQLGRLDFQAAPVPADRVVEIAFDFLPPLVTDTHRIQRLEVRFDNTPLHSFIAGREAPADGMRVRVPSGLWNSRRTADLVLGFPDAVAPATLDRNPKGDTRVLAFSARKITFRIVAPAEEGPAVSTGSPQP